MTKKQYLKIKKNIKRYIRNEENNIKRIDPHSDRAVKRMMIWYSDLIHDRYALLQLERFYKN